jgi:hypothetical protein
MGKHVLVARTLTVSFNNKLRRSVTHPGFFCLTHIAEAAITSSSALARINCSSVTGQGKVCVIAEPSLQP